ncbi:hypothetical protein DCAR_0209285 [Daucus carota subsp. sativus]|uniref:Uncharacterized protein n=1 Tax=Daucus carota subsp. sativus TaxID=79200 RepID=A0A162AXT4_DAUCS|nr:hypothetical protein DCAR_0209285 [Daucus carota subsp. sativus]
MTCYNSAKLVMVVSTLVFLSGSLPQGHALLTGLLNITRIQFTTSQLACTATGNPPSTGGGVDGIGGALLSGTCNGVGGNGSGILTHIDGFATGILTLARGITIDPSTRLPCFVTVRLPVTGTTCTVLPPTGLLQAAMELVDVVSSPIFGSLAVATTGLWVMVP